MMKLFKELIIQSMV